MKQIIILLFILGNFAAKGQSESQINITSTGLLVCSDVSVVLYVADLTSSCTPVGVSNPILVSTSGNVTLGYSDISNGVGWATDPGAYDFSTNRWSFVGADIYNCISTQTTGSSCFSGFYNAITIGVLTCYTQGSGCFEYSTNCTSCSTGQAISTNFGYGGAGGISTLDVSEL